MAKIKKDAVIGTDNKVLDEAIQAEDAVVNTAQGESEGNGVPVISVEPALVKFTFRSAKKAGDDGAMLTMPASAPVELSLPYITPDLGLVQIAAAGKPEFNMFVTDLVNAAIYAAARTQISDWQTTNPGEDVPPDVLNYNDLTVWALATSPKAERGTGIRADQWADFGEDYVATMTVKFPERDAAKVQRQADVLMSRLELVRGKPNVIAQMAITTKIKPGSLGVYPMSFLEQWWLDTDRQKDFTAIYEFLLAKAQKLYNVDDSDALASLI